jgi:WD40 repeat protein
LAPQGSADQPSDESEKAMDLPTNRNLLVGGLATVGICAVLGVLALDIGLLTTHGFLDSTDAAKPARRARLPESLTWIQPRLTLPVRFRWVHAVAFAPDGRTLAVAGDGWYNQPGQLVLWDLTAGQSRAALPGHRGGVLSVAFTYDGALLASADFDGAVKLWDVATGTERTTLVEHGLEAHAVAFSPDGLTLASAHLNGMIQLWDVATGAARATLRGHASVVRTVAFAPDGATLASGGLDRTVRLWDVASVRPSGVKASAVTGAV